MGRIPDFDQFDGAFFGIAWAHMAGGDRSTEVNCFWRPLMKL